MKCVYLEALLMYFHKFSFWFICPPVGVSRNEERTFCQAKMDGTNVLF